MRRQTAMAVYMVWVQLTMAALVVGGEVREPEERLAEFTPPPRLCYGRCLSRCADARVGWFLCRWRVDDLLERPCVSLIVW